MNVFNFLTRCILVCIIIVYAELRINDYKSVTFQKNVNNESILNHIYKTVI